MKLGSSGYFVKNGEVIGQYHFSFHDCRFHWGLFNGIVAHYWTEEEVIEEAESNGWEIVSPDKVEITYKLKGGTQNDEPSAVHRRRTKNNRSV